MQRSLVINLGAVYTTQFEEKTHNPLIRTITVPGHSSTQSLKNFGGKVDKRKPVQMLTPLVSYNSIVR